MFLETALSWKLRPRTIQLTVLRLVGDCRERDQCPWSASKQPRHTPAEDHDSRVLCGDHFHQRLEPRRCVEHRQRLDVGWKRDGLEHPGLRCGEDRKPVSAIGELGPVRTRPRPIGLLAVHASPGEQLVQRGVVRRPRREPIVIEIDVDAEHRLPVARELAQLPKRPQANGRSHRPPRSQLARSDGSACGAGCCRCHDTAGRAETNSATGIAARPLQRGHCSGVNESTLRRRPSPHRGQFRNTAAASFGWRSSPEVRIAPGAPNRTSEATKTTARTRRDTDGPRVTGPRSGVRSIMRVRRTGSEQTNRSKPPRSEPRVTRSRGTICASASYANARPKPSTGRVASHP